MNEEPEIYEDSEYWKALRRIHEMGSKHGNEVAELHKMFVPFQPQKSPETALTANKPDLNVELYCVDGKYVRTEGMIKNYVNGPAKHINEYISSSELLVNTSGELDPNTIRQSFARVEVNSDVMYINIYRSGQGNLRERSLLTLEYSPSMALVGIIIGVSGIKGLKNGRYIFDYPHSGLIKPIINHCYFHDDEWNPVVPNGTGAYEKILEVAEELLRRPLLEVLDEKDPSLLKSVQPDPSLKAPDTKMLRAGISGNNFSGPSKIS